MLQLIVGILIATMVIVVNEYASQQKLIGGELARKIPHITLSLIFAALPFFITLHQLALLAGVDVLIVALVYKFNWFRHSRSIDRKTWGDYFFLFGTIGAALLTKSRWVFAAAILTMGIADAAAALIGRPYGKHRYKIRGNNKSVEGTLAFIVVSAMVTVWVVYVTPAGLSSSWPAVILLPLAASLIEAVAPYGIDNLLIPLFVAVVLNYFL